jgi:hypothetical protein
MKDTWVKRGFIVSVIILFIGITVAPSINFSVVKASTDDDLVEVTTQAYGIKGYGNTTVKLTREQYNNLEEYLVEFRARLNQTSTREEAIPIFKDAVVELDKYGLLPRGMSVERVMRLITKSNDQRLKGLDSLGLDPDANYFCLVSGLTTSVMSFSPLNNLAQMSIHLFEDFENTHRDLIIRLIELTEKIHEKIVNISTWLQNHNMVLFRTLIWLLLVPIPISAMIIFYQVLFAGYLTSVFPFGLLSVLTFGLLSVYDDFSSSGWMFSIGLNGVKKYEGNELWGTARKQGLETAFQYCFPGALGFTGLKIGVLFEKTFFLGSALKVKLSPDKPPDPY